jgi:preprotein translocase SecE subunit
VASRAQRRAMRRAKQGEQQPGFADRARQRQAQVRPSQQPARGQTGRREAPRGSFVREAVAELRKVEWPDQKQVTTGSVVVVIACAIVGAYLWVNDLIWQRVVEAIL